MFYMFRFRRYSIVICINYQIPTSMKRSCHRYEDPDSVVSIQSGVALQQLIHNNLNFPFFVVQQKQRLAAESVHESANPQSSSRETDTTPWCNHSSHNAAQPAAGLSGPPGLGILGVSAC